MIEDIRNFSLEELEKNFKAGGFEPYRSRQVFEWVYKKGADTTASMTNLSTDMKAFLDKYYSLSLPDIRELQTSSDRTQKFLLHLKDGSLVESVLIPAKDRLTACLSTQVGCRYACAFCASGMGGFKRNMEVSEILGEFLLMRKQSAQPISNVVFMGIGEPLDNYQHLMKAIRIMNDERGIKLGARKMTISTCGLADAIERLSKEGLQLELSVSLHAATDEKRDELMPVNKRFPLEVLMKALRIYAKATKRKITLEYILLGGYNTSVGDAQALIRVLHGLHCHVNLIPYNNVLARKAYQAPAKLEVLFFKSYLEKHGVETLVRMPRGADIAAACGQLKHQHKSGM